MEERTGNFKSTGGKRSFNIVDLLLILFALAVAFFVFFVLDPFGLNVLDKDSKGTEITYRISISGLDEAFVGKIEEGAPVFDANTKKYLGVVESVGEPATHMSIRAEGAAGILYPVQGLYDFTVTIRADADYTKNLGYSVDGTRISVGTEYTLIFPQYTGSGYCISIEE